MDYLNDPREMQICPQSGVTWEEDNRVETMYHWGPMILDLCNLPVEEYMKPMTVITISSGGTPSSGGGSTTLYFGTQLSGSTPSFDSTESFDVSDTTAGYTTHIIIPMSEEYAEMYAKFDNDEIPEEEWEEWLSDFQTRNQLVSRIFIPSNILGAYSFEIDDIGLGSRKIDYQYVSTVNDAEGNEYMIYEYPNMDCTIKQKADITPTERESKVKVKITFTLK